MSPTVAGRSRTTRFGEFAAQAAVLEREGDWDAVARLYADGYRRAMDDGDMEQAATALLGRGQALGRKGCFREAEDLARQCSELAERNGLLGASARSISLLGVIRFFQSDYTAAADFYTRARDIARALSDDFLVWSTTQNLGIIANIHGDFHEAKALYLESIGSAIRAENREGAMRTYLNLGKACVCLEDWLEAEVYFDRGIEIAEQLGELPVRTRLYANLAIPLIHTGEFTRATAALDRAVQLATRILDTETLSHIARLRGMIARLRGNFAVAREHLTEALSFATGPGCELAHAEALEEKGRLHQVEGQLENASSVFAEARTALLALGAQHDVARIEDLLSQCGTVAATPLASGTTL